MQGHLPKHQTGQQITDQGCLDLNLRPVNSKILNSVQAEPNKRKVSCQEIPMIQKLTERSSTLRPPPEATILWVFLLPRTPACTAPMFSQLLPKLEINEVPLDCSCASWLQAALSAAASPRQRPVVPTGTCDRQA